MSERFRTSFAKRRRVVIVVAAVVVAAVMAAVLWPKEREPEYQGKKLSEWINVGSREGPEAVQAIGTNALPCLVRWISYHEPRWHASAVARLQGKTGVPRMHNGILRV